MEQLHASQRPIAEIVSDVEQTVPALLDLLRSSNGDEQRPLFLADEIENPKFTYDELMQQDFDDIDTRLGELGEELAQNPDLDEHFRGTFADFITERRLQTQLLRSFQTYQSLPDGPERDEAAAEYQRLNEALFGEVDESTMHALLSNKLRSYALEPGDVLAQQVLDELKTLVPKEALEELPPPYAVSEETFEAVKVMAEALYDKLLKHVPDRDEIYSSDEILAILTKIVREEFGESAADWIVRHNKQKGLSVEPLSKEVRVSPTITADGPKLRGLVAHELGVHMLKAVRGYETGLLPFAIGMAGYGAAEEGTGMVMQQAVTGKFEIAGTGHYITAGLLKQGRNFRGAFEVNWRLKALDSLKPGEALTEAAISEARGTAYSNTIRLGKGGMPSPFSRDLLYYNGTKAMWEYFGRYGADELMLNLAMLGKLDPTKPPHLQTALETRTN